MKWRAFRLAMVEKKMPSDHGNSFDLHIFIHGTDQSGVMQQLADIQKTLGEIKVTDAEVKALLDKVDVTTNKIADNLTTVATAQQSEADTIQTISNEIDALVAGQGTNGISAETAAQL